MYPICLFLASTQTASFYSSRGKSIPVTLWSLYSWCYALRKSNVPITPLQICYTPSSRWMNPTLPYKSGLLMCQQLHMMTLRISWGMFRFITVVPFAWRRIKNLRGISFDYWPVSSRITNILMIISEPCFPISQQEESLQEWMWTRGTWRNVWYTWFPSLGAPRGQVRPPKKSEALPSEKSQAHKPDIPPHAPVLESQLWYTNFNI
jgi:hypothetical protein